MAGIHDGIGMDNNILREVGDGSSTFYGRTNG
jgi:hypothetical protein